MRHIPEEELHAYLDQALSRSQCVEIERHLARCPRCQMERDSIAALRDRTTAILARVGPPPIIPPAFETLVARAEARKAERTRWVRRGGMAAAIGGVLLLGWWSSGRLFRPAELPAVAVVPATTPSRDVPATVAVTTTAPAPERPRAATRTAAARARPEPATTPREVQLVRASRPVGDEAPDASDFALASEVDPASAAKSAATTPSQTVSAEETPTFELSDLVAQPVADDPGLNGLWRTIEPDNAADRRDNIALVPGLPVVQMRVQPGNRGDDVTAVDQTLESGELIRTISGPAPRVLALVNEDAATPDTTHLESRPGNMTVTIRQADRMVAVTGPANALGSLLSRVSIKNQKRRY
ncbi:MAG: zf-HC2 domain-containing protein [Gemmatimonadales bacterium]